MYNWILSKHMTTRERKLLALVSLILGIFFIYLSFLVNKDVFRDFDYKTMVNIQSIIDSKFDIPFSIFTLLGSTEVTLSALILIFLSILIFKKRFFLGLLIYFFLFIIEIAGKLFIFHPMPPPFFHRYAFNFYFPSQFVVDTKFAYPSGHMARSAFVAVILLLIIFRGKSLRQKRLLTAVPIIIFIIIMFISRVYLGEHWFSDVLGGLLLGVGAGTLALSFW